MNVVGIAGDCEHNSSAALFRDGELVYAEAEERFSRIKGDGAFPQSALAEALSRCNDGPQFIAAAGRADIEHEHAGSYRNQVSMFAGALASDVEYVDHHRAHALTAAFFASEDHSSIFTADGQGDSLTATFSTWSPSGLKRRWVNSVRDGSLGFFFAAITEYLGYTRLRDEGKVTALAATGEGRPELQAFLAEVVWNDLSAPKVPRLRVSPRYVGVYRVGQPLYTTALTSRLREFRPEDVAFAAQERLEEVLVELLSALDVQPGALSLAGGLFGNVRLNYRVAERLPCVSKLAIAPPMGDEGLAIGAALDVLLRHGVEMPRPQSLALGRVASALSIECIVREFPDYDVVEAAPSEIVAAAAELLAIGFPVARCSGRGEFGPRALGNRSLFYRPDDPSCREWLNVSLGRDSVMPFAPCVREEDLAKVSGVDPIRFAGLGDMTVAVPATDWFRHACPGVVHGDGTVRAQSVRNTNFPDLWELLSRYSARSGLPALLNTSLNRHGEPIVGTTLDAMKCVAASGLPVLWAGDSQLIFARSAQTSVARLF